MSGTHRRRTEEAIGPGLLVRCDRADATHAFLDHVVARGLRFLDLTEPVREAIVAVPEREWQPAIAQGGEDREGAWVAELALDLSAWPAGTRAICRRERPHPGAQLSFTDENGYRFQVFLTNPAGLAHRPLGLTTVRLPPSHRRPRPRSRTGSRRASPRLLNDPG